MVYVSVRGVVPGIAVTIGDLSCAGSEPFIRQIHILRLMLGPAYTSIKIGVLHIWLHVAFSQYLEPFQSLGYLVCETPSFISGRAFAIYVGLSCCMCGVMNLLVVGVFRVIFIEF